MTAHVDGEFDFFAPLPGQAAATPADGPAPLLRGQMGVPSLPPPGTNGPQGKASRWVKSDTTFGPVGRVVATICLVVPFVLLVAAGIFTFDPFVFGGAAIWMGLMVMGLRQVWQLVEHHHRR
ncbi:MAG: hypothetical protein ABI720_05690 [Actinomycetes bacterium]